MASAAFAEPAMQDDLKWLETMAFAAHQTNYSGTFVYQFGSHVEVSRITHVTDQSGEYGRLESLDGDRREIIRHNGEVWCYTGNSRIKLDGPHTKEFPALLPDKQSLSKINRNYQVRQSGEARVAGFNTFTVQFVPNDNLRYGRMMWVDGTSGLLLKSEVVDEHGAVVEQYAFTQLAIGGNIDRSWITETVTGQNKPGIPASAPARMQHDPDSHDSARKAVAVTASGWQVDAMPEGFGKIAELRRPMHNRAGSAIQMVYSDGLASISVFIEENDNDEDDHPGLTSQGAIQVYSRFLDDHLVTVVGEVPPQTVIQVGDSVRFAGN